MSYAPPTLPHEGSMLAGRYLLGRVLGKGAMGIVYDAHQTRLDQRVAIKVLRPEILGEAGLVARFEREARIIAKLSSRHIVRVLDVDVAESGLPFLVMEFLDGWDLAAELRARGPLPIERAIELVGQLCRGVEDAHRAGVVHRDLKPSNVFLVANTDRGAAPDARLVKIVDFGVSKLVGSDTDMTATASTLGTPRYMSPEQIRSSKNVDGRSDVWAIGTILFELLTGRTPFQGESATGVAAAIVIEDPYPLRQLRPDVPEWIENLVMSSLVKDPARRIGSAAAFLAGLDQGSTWTKPNLPLIPSPSGATSAALSPPQSLSGSSPHGSSQLSPAQLSPVQWQPGPAPMGTQSSWTSAEGAPPRASKAPLIALFLGVFALVAGGALLLLLLGVGTHRAPRTEAAGASPGTTATAVATVATASAATPSAPLATSDVASPSPPVSETARVGTSTATSIATLPTTPSTTGTPVAQTTPPHETHSPPPPPPPKDCPASRKILVGGKLTCP